MPKKKKQDDLGNPDAEPELPEFISPSWEALPAGFEMMLEYCRAIQFEGMPRNEVLVFFAGAFEKILRGKNVKAALQIALKRGRNSEADLERALDNAEAVAMLKRSGATYREAIRDAAERSGQSEKTVRRHYSKYRVFAERLVDCIRPAWGHK